jgi:hypothetical protein
MSLPATTFEQSAASIIRTSDHVLIRGVALNQCRLPVLPLAKRGIYRRQSNPSASRLAIWRGWVL